MNLTQSLARHRRIGRLFSTASAVAGLALIVAAYLSGTQCPPVATVLVGSALICHWIIRPRYSNGRAA